MASSKSYLDFILEQLSELEDISYRAMTAAAYASNRYNMHTPATLHLFTVVNGVACSSLYCINDGAAMNDTCGSGGAECRILFWRKKSENAA